VCAVYACRYTLICTSIDMHKHMRTYTHTYILACMHTLIHRQTCIQTLCNVSLNVCVYMVINLNIYLYIYTFAYIHYMYSDVGQFFRVANVLSGLHLSI